jgi:hypothetical protein
MFICFIVNDTYRPKAKCKNDIGLLDNDVTSTALPPTRPVAQKRLYTTQIFVYNCLVAFHQNSATNATET